MLDELKELKLYAFNVDDPALFPIEGRLIKLGRPSGKSKEGTVDFENVARALEIIARQYLFDGGAAFVQAADRAKDALQVLRAWCGFLAKGEEAPNVEGMGEYRRWMPRYIKAYLDPFPEKELTLEDVLDAWQGKGPRYDVGIYDNSTVIKDNEPRFELCVARALRRGPLRRWCMVGKLVPNEACATLPNGRALDSRNNGAVLTATALCLMGLQRGEDKSPGVPGEAGYVPLSMQELGRWCCLPKEFSKATLKSWLYQGEPLLKQHEEQSGVKPWQISQGWLDEGQWQLIDITDGHDALQEFCEEHKGEGFRCYMDDDYEQPDFKPDKYYKRWRHFACDDLEMQLIA